MNSKITKWKRLDSKIYEHSQYRKIEDVLFEMHDGQQRWFALKKEGSAVCILAITEDQKIILAREFRPGPDCILDELPGGSVDAGETPLEAVRRELLEETGYEASNIYSLGRIYECAYSTINRQAFVALNCKKIADQKLDPTENIEIILKPIPEFIEQLMQGLCTDAEVAWMGLYFLRIITHQT